MAVSLILDKRHHNKILNEGDALMNFVYVHSLQTTFGKTDRQTGKQTHTDRQTDTNTHTNRQTLDPPRLLTILLLATIMEEEEEEEEEEERYTKKIK